MKHKLPLLLFVLLCLALAGAFLKHAEVRVLQKRVAALEGERDALASTELAAKPVPEAVRVPPMPTAPLRSQAPVPVNAAAPPVAVGAVAGAPDQQILLGDAHGLISQLVKEREEKMNEEASPAAALGKMLENPEMRKIRAAQVDLQVVSNHGRFFERAGLDEATRTSFHQLLAERMEQRMAIGSDWLQLSQAERAEMAEDMQATDEEYKEEIQELLGAETSAAFEQWEAELPRRRSVDEISGKMRGESALPEDMKEQLVRLMVLRDAEIEDPSAVFAKSGQAPTKKMLADAMERQIELNRLYIQDAKVLLSESQHEIFVKGIESEQKMMEITAKMGAEVLGIE